MSERNYQIIIGILVLIIIIGGWFIVAKPATSPSGEVTDNGSASTSSDQSAASSGADPSGSSSVPAQNTPTTSDSSDFVSVVDQSAASSVAVASVSLGQDGWVAVRDADGRILGAGWFPTGTQTDVSVPLLRATAAGQHYQILLYTDDGDKLFDFHKDMLVANSDGSVAGTTFTAN